MSGHLSPDTAPRNPMHNERGSSTRLLLLVLLLVVAAGGYLYFFTGLIRPKEAAKPPVVQTAQVKKPIPPRPSEPGASGEAPAKPAEAKPSQGTPPSPAPAKAKQEAAQKGAPAAPPAKPEPAKMAKAEAPQKPAAAGGAAPAKPAVAPAKPAAPAMAKPAVAPAKPAAPATAKPAVASPKVAQAPAAKPAPVQTKHAAATPAKRAPKVTKRAVKVKGGAYALQVGDYVTDKTFETVQAKLKKSGIVPVRITAVSAPEPMKRLEVAQFSDQDQAEAELQKLKKLTPDAFLVADNGTYSLYAGSYMGAGQLHSQQRRLGAKGVKTVVKTVQVPIKVMRVSAGSYASAEEARKDAQSLKKLGLTTKVVIAGK